MNYFVLFYSTSEDKTLPASLHILHLLDGSGKFWLQIKIKVFREYYDQDKTSRPVQSCIYYQNTKLHFFLSAFPITFLNRWDQDDCFAAGDLQIRSSHFILERK